MVALVLVAGPGLQSSMTLILMPYPVGLSFERFWFWAFLEGAREWLDILFRVPVSVMALNRNFTSWRVFYGHTPDPGRFLPSEANTLHVEI